MQCRYLFDLYADGEDALLQGLLRPVTTSTLCIPKEPVSSLNTRCSCHTIPMNASGSFSNAVIGVKSEQQAALV